ncbi:hypothetical protein [Sediminicurvatus halobius]|uniref:hypothetical protein n=1 Tax=Sediminicurvatus halobius TaxID=2182432 RepID=UPI001304FF40|nr:hypothetical protein [Spiribacter halobius]UEX79200.1 hypothetical protein LMH63_06065 [Spiribacter halobius]
MVFVLTLSASFMMACSLYGVLRGRLGWAERLILLLGPATFLAYLFMGSAWLGIVAPALLAVVYAYRRQVGTPIAANA